MLTPIKIIGMASENGCGTFTVELGVNVYVQVNTDFKGKFSTPRGIYGCGEYNDLFGEEDAIKAVKAFLEECGNSVEKAEAYFDSFREINSAIRAAVMECFHRGESGKGIWAEDGAVRCPDYGSAVAVHDILGGIVSDRLKSEYEVIL